MKHSKWNERGQSFVETAIGMVVLIITLGGLFDVGRSFIILSAIENATGEGALYGATHPECLMADHASTICNGSHSVEGRVREEAKPLISLDVSNADVTIEVENGTGVTKGSILRVDVTYRYTPLTPIGQMIWGTNAEVRATARQKIMSPPSPGYTY